MKRRTRRKRARIDWRTVRDTIDLAEAATRLLGPAPGRRGARGRKLWWPCPLGTHEDQNPSFCITPGKPWWKCFGCGEYGDAATLVMKTKGVTFPAAVAFLAGGPAPTKPLTSRPRPPERPPANDPAPPEGMIEADALALVVDAERRLWTPEGADALASLHGRGLDDTTIRAARLGVALPLALPGRPRGIVLPWFDGDCLTLVKIRQPEGRKPKYYEAFRNRDRPPGIYLGRHVIRSGRALVIVEGEFDCLLVGQELADLAAVVTLGSASARPYPSTLGSMLAAFPWYVATDNDPAGDKAAADWPPTARRVRPPMLRPHPDDRVEKPKTDWTDLYRHGVNLRRWWSDCLGGIAAPPMFAWDDLAGWRWGPTRDDSTPGIIIDRPDPARRQAAIEAADPFDAYALAERVAIQEEN
jgi:hypothetical protein